MSALPLLITFSILTESSEQLCDISVNLRNLQKPVQISRDVQQMNLAKLL